MEESFKTMFIRRIRARFADGFRNNVYSAYSGLIPAISGEILAKEKQISVIQPIRGEIPPISARLRNGVSNKVNSGYSGAFGSDLVKVLQTKDDSAYSSLIGEVT